MGGRPCLPAELRGRSCTSRHHLRPGRVLARQYDWVLRISGLQSPLVPVLVSVSTGPHSWFVLDKIVVFLQRASTVATFALFKLSGTPVIKEGFLLSLPSVQIEVAKQCSGIRSSEMLLITGLILAHLFLKKFWSQLIFVVSIVPMAIAKNAIRIFTLTMLGIHVDPGFLEGRLHHEGGGVFFALSLAILLGLLWALQVLEKRMRLAKGVRSLGAVGKTA
jgi:exosortase